MKKIVGPILMALTMLPGAGRGQTNAASPADEEHFTAERNRMVHDQLLGPIYHITNSHVLAAMGKVPRHRFVPAEIRHRAYDDCALPIGHGQTISQPFIVAFMTQQLDPKRTDRVLEVGTGSGYQAAVLAELVKEVYTIEIVEPLAQRAKADLHQLGYTNIQVRAGDGYLGWPEAAPFDAVIVTCAPKQVPPPLVDQLRPGGRMIIPIGPEWDQNLVLLRKEGDRLVEHAVLPVRFVPMTGKARPGDAK
ncbi:MAG TPA: protein-L-isoaspartate(D-aspartate) O-methyltransferase [Candidatus Acidoferrum sp.]|nr:protein-L-isoaspartate(D-aspartate) O-methyltransferase [Candidatus Acidoferrum sp.]